MRRPDPPFQLDFTPRFEQEVDLLLGLERGAEVLEGLQLVLERDPEAGQLVPDTDVRVVQIQAPDARGQFSVFYRIEAEAGIVILLSLQPVRMEDLG